MRIINIGVAIVISLYLSGVTNSFPEEYSTAPFGVYPKKRGFIFINRDIKT